MRTGASSGVSSSRSAADGSVKPNRSSRVKVLLLRPGTAVIPPPPTATAPGSAPDQGRVRAYPQRAGGGQARNGYARAVPVTTRPRGALSTRRASRCGSFPYQTYETRKPKARQMMPPTASSQKWLAVETMTTRVAAG